MTAQLVSGKGRSGMQKENSPLPMLVGGVLIAAALCTLLVNGGWLIWIPTLLALAVVGTFFGTSRRS